ncbi:hypothetical protein Ppa06_29870 [Planomonospora parontospora subsp. parontospora]|uniref:Uncharacterized protein n=2 Tax=Planomonospora parontospora TaxID=58119 RepID=A0AA37F585_9ACTN|nr:hypothetical protein [Planomonospora parontospora]GGK71666.1 hypothetical protein GCM10010126_33960 [Planomonospora parontospora]GII09189.1 hypothetical protein Ppa06_29870 [Planomonospora parontospora subsp. parontospora]
MTDSPDEYGELLRRALSAEADSVVPSPDGLEIIRARIERRGLRRLTWWRAGASVAGAALVAASVVMVVPGLREQVAQITFSGDVKPVTPAHTDLSGTSRPLPPKNGQVPPAVTRSGAPPPPAPEESRRTTPSPPPQPTPDPTRKPTPTPTPTCPTATAEAVPVEPPAECEETATPAPTPSESATPSESPCPADGCQQVEEPPQPEPPLPSEQVTPTPIGG